MSSRKPRKNQFDPNDHGDDPNRDPLEEGEAGADASSEPADPEFLMDESESADAGSGAPTQDARGADRAPADDWTQDMVLLDDADLFDDLGSGAATPPASAKHAEELADAGSSLDEDEAPVFVLGDDSDAFDDLGVSPSAAESSESGALSMDAKGSKERSGGENFDKFLKDIMAEDKSIQAKSNREIGSPDLSSEEPEDLPTTSRKPGAPGKADAMESVFPSWMRGDLVGETPAPAVAPPAAAVQEAKEDEASWLDRDSAKELASAQPEIDGVNANWNFQSEAEAQKPIPFSEEPEPVAAQEEDTAYEPQSVSAPARAPARAAAAHAPKAGTKKAARRGSSRAAWAMAAGFLLMATAGAGYFYRERLLKAWPGLREQVREQIAKLDPRSKATPAPAPALTPKPEPSVAVTETLEDPTPPEVVPSDPTPEIVAPGPELGPETAVVTTEPEVPPVSATAPITVESSSPVAPIPPPAPTHRTTRVTEPSPPKVRVQPAGTDPRRADQNAQPKGDTVLELANGHQFRGRIKRILNDRITLGIDKGEVTFSLSEVKLLDKNSAEFKKLTDLPEASVTLFNGQRLRGRLLRENGDHVVLVFDNGRLTVPRGDIRSVSFSGRIHF